MGWHHIWVHSNLRPHYPTTPLVTPLEHLESGNPLKNHPIIDNNTAVNSFWKADEKVIYYVNMMGVFEKV